MQYEQGKWDLRSLFPSHESPELKNAFLTIENHVKDLESRRSSLIQDISIENFLEILEMSEKIEQSANRLYSFAGLSFTADTQNQTAQTLQTRAQQFLASIENRTLFLRMWWKELDERNALRLLQGAGDYRYYLETLRHFKPHTLTEAEEKIVNTKNVTGSAALINLFDAMTNRYTFKLRVDGKLKEMTAPELQSFRFSTDPKMRAKSYQEQLRVYGNDGVILGQMYQTRVRDWHNENIEMRKFGSPIAVRNLMNDIPDQAVDILLETARNNVSIFQRYFKVKAKHIGMKKLRRYDIYAPVEHSEKTYDFNAAAHMVIDSFTAFDVKVADLARRVFDEKRLDSEIRKGKRGGAFCWSVVPTMTPWVLINYQGTAREVATLAHELGHAIHSMLAAHHNTFSFHASLPLAETASTFGEMMLIDKMLAEESDQTVRKDMLFKQMDDAYATIMRQSYFALFEKRAHAMIEQNASIDDLCAEYLGNLHEQFADSVEVSDDFKWEWVSIPHIYHTPFYVYAYAFGQLLVLSLYEQYRVEGESFKPKYLKILGAGGSEAPEKILGEAGIDIHSAEFWQGGFNVLNKLVDTLENLR